VKDYVRDLLYIANWALAGAGKSFIAFSFLLLVSNLLSSRVIDYLLAIAQNAKANSVKVGIAYLYLEYDKQEEQTAPTLIKCLLKQLLCQQDVLPSELEESYRYRQTLEMKVVSNLLMNCISGFFKVFIILDALDECDKRQRDILIPQLRVLLQNDAKLCYTTRHELQSPISCEKMARIEITAQPGDLITFLTLQLEQHDPQNKLSDLDRNNIIKKIVNQSQNMYAQVMCQKMIVDFDSLHCNVIMF
jgi:hypothetical protein